MASIDLLFSQLPVTGQPVEIVFGADEDTPTVATDAYLSGTLPQPVLQGTIYIGPVVDAAISATLPQPGLDALLDVRQVYAVQLAGTLPQPVLLADLPAEYLTNTARPTIGRARAPWAPSNPVETGAKDSSQDTVHIPSGAAPRWQQAAQVPARISAALSNALRAPVLHGTGFGQGVHLATRAQALHQDAQRSVRNLLRDAFANAERAQTQPLTQRHHDGLRDRRPLRQTQWQVAQPTPPKSYTSRQGPAQWRDTGFGGDYQNAMRPPPGIYVRPGPAQPEPCYLPTLPAHLVFDDLADSSLPTHLVFVCERHGPGPGPDPEPGETIVVPIRRVYVTVNSLTLVRVDGAVPIPAYSFSMSIDVDSWTWQWQATLHADALPLITPAANGDAVEVLATINGVPYRLCCEGYTRQRQFAQTRIAVKGRGRAALLDAPYAPTLNHGNATARTAQQLMADVLTINNVGIGWGVEFGLTDWLVPGNVWAHQGPYISAILDIAGAAGGYVQPHDTAATLRVLPRYPAAPWAWGALTPNFELPAAVVSVEGTDWQQKPAYNRVFVAGTSAGVLGDVVRAGTAGEVLAPMVTHPLITHADAARQRGIAELSNTGRQAHLSLRLPVLQETGVIKPGALVRYVDAGTPRLGLVRGTQVEWSAPTLRQVLAVETHV